MSTTTITEVDATEAFAEALTDLGVEIAITDIIVRALKDLGEHPDAVAHRLARAGCVGIPVRADACPVAVYLRSRLRGGMVKVGWQTVTVDCPDDLVVEVLTPMAVRNFIRRYDFGEYPELSCEWQLAR